MGNCLSNNSATRNQLYVPVHPDPPHAPQAVEAPLQSVRSSEGRYARIADNYRSLDEVIAALKKAGLESSNLIVGIDFTKSNEWTGAKSFNGRSLHHIGEELNHYEEAIFIIGKTLSAFDEDKLIPCFGFGDASTHDKDVFSFYGDDRKCREFGEVLSRYRELVPQLRLAGPTSFAPVIEKAMTIVEESEGQFHVLLIVADGQVSHLSPQEKATIDAIVKASECPLSIVLVGVGDGPWDMMKEFDDNIPARAFDNFQFVNFTEIMSKNEDASRKQSEFALSALMEIPAQYKACIEHGLLGRRTGYSPDRVSLPPPQYNGAAARRGSASERVSLPPLQYNNTTVRIDSTPERVSLSPRQYNTATEHVRIGSTSGRVSRPPPQYNRADVHGGSTSERFSGLQHQFSRIPESARSNSISVLEIGESSASPHSDRSTASASTSAHDRQICSNCDNNTTVTVLSFNCGHQACGDCLQDGCLICLV